MVESKAESEAERKILTTMRAGLKKNKINSKLSLLHYEKYFLSLSLILNDIITYAKKFNF